MPDLVLKEILECLDFKSVLNLRKVSQRLRKYINDFRMTSNLKSIELFNRKKIFVRFRHHSEQFEIEYGKLLTECLVSWKWEEDEEKRKKKKLLENANWNTVMVNDLVILLKHQNSPLETLKLNFHDHRDHPDATDFFTKLEVGLCSLKHPIKVEKLLTRGFKSQHILSVLPYIDSESLKTIEILISSGSGELESEAIIETEVTEELKNLKQWERAAEKRVKVYTDFSFVTDEFHMMRLYDYQIRRYRARERLYYH